MSIGVDEQYTGRYLACCLNFERMITVLFGDNHSLGSRLTFTLQFRDLTKVPEPTEASAPLPANIAKYIVSTALYSEDYEQAGRGR